MIAKVVLGRPNVAALCMVGSRQAMSCLRGVTSTITMKSNRLSSDHSIYLRERLISSFNYSNLHSGRAFCIRASTESGSIGSPLIESMTKKIKEQLSADSVIVKDAYSDGRHVSIDVISSAFEGKSVVNR